MATVLDPAVIASSFRDAIRADVAALPEPLVLVGFLASDLTGEGQKPSVTYADYTRRGCDDVGVKFDLREVPRLAMESAIREANADPKVHGILIYYPVFGTGQDVYLRELVAPDKDIEGLHPLWAKCLYENRRFIDQARTKKAILPCTPLAVIKLLDAAGAFSREGKPLAGKRVCIFNRSEVVGRPLASMMANDGAEVTSFDIDGPQLFLPAPDGGAHVVETTATRPSALAEADIVVTGVPTKSFPPILASEIREGIFVLNFSTRKNFTDEAADKASVFIPRVGPMTVTMALRNAFRLYRDAHV